MKKPAPRAALHPPAAGSGKTHLARALAAEARLPVVLVNGGECVGEHAERNLRRAFAAGGSQCAMSAGTAGSSRLWTLAASDWAAHGVRAGCGRARVLHTPGPLPSMHASPRARLLPAAHRAPGTLRHTPPPRAAKSQQPCILLLDELDALAPARAASHSEHERQATARLLAAIDELRASRCRVGLVGATNQRARVDGALRRAGRLDGEVALGVLGEEERLAVLRCCTQRMPLAPDVDLPGIAAQLRGYVAADVAAVASEAGLLCAAAAVGAAEAEGRLAEVEEEAFLAGLRVTPEHFEAAVAQLGPAVLRGLAPEVPQIGWDDVGGLEVRPAP